LIGGSLALALRHSGYRGRITGVSSPASIAEGKRLGAIDEGTGYDDLPGAAAQSDLVVLATPIYRIIEQLEILGRSSLSPGTLVTDVGSTKREILAAAREALPPEIHFIGGHPMAGSEKRGVTAADPFLFQNAYYILTPNPETPEAQLHRLRNMAASTGAHVVILSTEDHDRIAAAISHLPQLLSVALVNSLDDLGPLKEIAVRLAAGGFRDMTRIASSPFDMWRDIIATNRSCITSSLTRFNSLLDQVSLQVDSWKMGEGELENAFRSAGETRSIIPRDTKGFLHPTWDVLVVAEDRPGEIARIAGVLADRSINIKDIEVLKVREGEGGSLRLGFATRQQADEAIRLLTGERYEARLRD